MKVVPTFKDVYSGFGAMLPGPTQFMIDLSEIVKKFLLLFIIAAAAAIWGWLHFIKTKAGPYILGFPPHQTADFWPHCA